MTFDEWWTDYCDSQYHEDYGIDLQPRDVAEAAFRSGMLVQREIDAKLCEDIRDTYRPLSSVDGPFEGADFCVDAIREQSK
jgi:hypothetical protein